MVTSIAKVDQKSEKRDLEEPAKLEALAVIDSDEDDFERFTELTNGEEDEDSFDLKKSCASFFKRNAMTCDAEVSVNEDDSPLGMGAFITTMIVFRVLANDTYALQMCFTNSGICSPHL